MKPPESLGVRLFFVDGFFAYSLHRNTQKPHKQGGIRTKTDHQAS